MQAGVSLEISGRRGHSLTMGILLIFQKYMRRLVINSMLTHTDFKRDLEKHTLWMGLNLNQISKVDENMEYLLDKVLKMV